MQVNYDLKRDIPNQTLQFHDWMKLWKAAKDLPTCLGLLHCLFNISFDGLRNEERKAQEAERIVFLLKLADGRRTSGEPLRISAADNELREKAFKLLARNVFHSEIGWRGYGGLPSGAVEAIFHFFRPLENHRGALANLGYHGGPRPFAYDAAMLFVLWACERFYYENLDQTIPSAHRKAIIRILNALDKLETLLHPEFEPDLGWWERQFDASALTALEEVVESQMRLRKGRWTLRDAVLLGSKAAYVLTLAKAAGVKMPKKQNA